MGTEQIAYGIGMILGNVRGVRSRQYFGGVMQGISRRAILSGRRVTGLLSGTRGTSVLKRVLASLMGVTAMFGLVGCDGGPGFGTRVVVINECRVDVAIAFSDTPSSPPDQDTSQKIDRLNAGQTDEWLLRPLKSSGPTVEYLWVAIPGASMWGSPTEVDIGELPLKDDSEVRGARVLRIAGDLCPS